MGLDLHAEFRVHSCWGQLLLALARVTNYGVFFSRSVDVTVGECSYRLARLSVKKARCGKISQPPASSCSLCRERSICSYVQLEHLAAGRRQAKRWARKPAGVLVRQCSKVGRPPSSTGNVKLGPSATNTIQPTSSSVPSASIVRVSARQFNVTLFLAQKAVEATAISAGPSPGPSAGKTAN